MATDKLTVETQLAVLAPSNHETLLIFYKLRTLLDFSIPDNFQGHDVGVGLHGWSSGFFVDAIAFSSLLFLGILFPGLFFGPFEFRLEIEKC